MKFSQLILEFDQNFDFKVKSGQIIDSYFIYQK